MKIILILLLSYIMAVFSKSQFEEYSTEDGMLLLTSTTFPQAIAQNENLFVNFYAPWSGHCQAFAREFVKAAQTIAETETGLDVKLAKVDFTAEKEFAQKYEITNYPTLLLFSKSKDFRPIVYAESRTASDIIDWLKKKIESNSVEVKTAKDIQSLAENNEVLVVFFGPSGTEASNNFLKASIDSNLITFAHSHDKTLADYFDTPSPSIVLFRKLDQEKIVLTDITSIEVIKKFVKENKNPAFLPLSEKAYEKIFREKIDTMFLLRNENEDSQRAEEILNEISNEVKGKLVLSIVNVNDSLGKRFVEFIHHDMKQFPAIILVQPRRKYWKYLFEDQINLENVRSFIQDFDDNKLKPFLKSQPIPDQIYEDDLLVVVGKNHDEIVFHGNSDVLIEYYASWDGHAKSFAPTYSALAKKFKNVPELRIAKMDFYANEIEGLDVDRYPKIRFYPKDKKQQFIDYHGSLTLEDMSQFLMEHSIRLQQFNKFIIDNIKEL